MRDISFYTDKNLRIISWGDEIAQFTGKPAATVLGSKYYEVLPQISVDGKDVLAEVAKKNRTVSIKDFQIPCLFAHMNAHIDIAPEVAANGSVARIKVVLHSSTTCSLANKLYESQKLINIGKIASTLAHGVRNPLNAIKGAVVYLSEKYQHEAQLVEFTRIMEEEISRLEDFITKFLSSSVLDTDIRETDVNSMLKRIETLTSLQIYTRNVQSLYEFGDIPPIAINSFHLEQAVLNVMNNAIEAIGSGGRLKIATSAEERDGSLFVVIAVSDTGRGMAIGPVGELPPDKPEKGRGFGLFITYEILRHYGGHLEIDSKENAGTTVKLFLPCRSAA